MAGPAIRAYQIASKLAEEHEVRLVSIERSELSSDSFYIHFTHDLTEDANWAEIIIIQGHVLWVHSWLKSLDKVIVVDAYDPIHLEKLEETREMDAEERRFTVAASVDMLNDQLERADFLLCASERQRLFWLGQLAGLGRIAPDLYDEDSTLKSFLAVVPFGMDDVAPLMRHHGLRGRVDGIGMDDKIIIWGGGIYNWFDPDTLVRAVARLASRHPELRLVFMGSVHANPAMPKARAATAARELAGELGVLDVSVFFLNEWVPFRQRGDYLLDADLGVSTHLDHLETTLSYRTRILDYLWSGLPIVTTDGDSFADIVREHGFGRVVAPGDVDELERVLEEFLYDQQAIQVARDNIAAKRDQFTWDAALKPLLEFCRNPMLSETRKRSRVAFFPARYREQEALAIALETQAVELRALAEELGARVAKQHDVLMEMRRSLSWRVTKPLRAPRKLRALAAAALAAKRNTSSTATADRHTDDR